MGERDEVYRWVDYHQKNGHYLEWEKGMKFVDELIIEEKSCSAVLVSNWALHNVSIFK